MEPVRRLISDFSQFLDNFTLLLWEAAKIPGKLAGLILAVVFFLGGFMMVYRLVKAFIFLFSE